MRNKTCVISWLGRVFSSSFLFIIFKTKVLNLHVSNVFDYDISYTHINRKKRQEHANLPNLHFALHDKIIDACFCFVYLFW